MPIIKHEPEFVEIEGHGRCEVLVVPKLSSTVEHRHYTRESFTHPAKMSTMLCREIIRRYTKPGDLVLDPMAGINTTGIEAALLGRNAVGVELEGKFVKMGKKNIKLLEKLKTPAPKGKAAIIQGDSRGLSKILGEKADAAVFSPPFADAEHHKNHGLKDLSGEGFKGRRSWREKEHVQEDYGKGNISRLKYGKPVDAVVFSPPYADKTIAKEFKSEEDLERFAKEQWVYKRGRSLEATKRFIKKSWQGYPENEKNIGNLPYRPVDAVVFSPPFARSDEGGKTGERNIRAKLLRGEKPSANFGGVRSLYAGISENPENIGNLKYGKPIDAIITSPPFKTANEGGGLNKRPPKTFRGVLKRHSFKLSGNPKNVDNIPYGRVDTIVTSPPYVPIDDRRVPWGHRHGALEENDRKRGFAGTGGFRGSYGDDAENIGNPRKYGSVDAIVTSPPYSDTPLQDYGTSNKALLEFERRVRRSFREKGYFEHGGRRYTEREWRGINRGELKPRGMPELWKQIISQRRGSSYSEIARVDAVITSPPYSESMTKRRKGYTTNPQLSKTRHMGVESSDENIGNLPHGQVDAVITSPPYSEGIGHDPGEGASEEFKQRLDMQRRYTRSMRSGGNIGSLPHGRVDSIITSPPYEGSMESGRHVGGINEREGLGEGGGAMSLPVHYSGSKENIGNRRGETYLSAMLRVYRECLRVLRPGGQMVLVLKDFVRNKRVVRLDLDTKRLCEAAGFRWVETKLFRLPSKSFWRTLYSKKYPDVDTSLLKFELVEVFEKPVEARA